MTIPCACVASAFTRTIAGVRETIILVSVTPTGSIAPPPDVPGVTQTSILVCVTPTKVVVGRPITARVGATGCERGGRPALGELLREARSRASKRFESGGNGNHDVIPELQLTRSSEDRKTFILGGVGKIRHRGWLKRSADLFAQSGETWRVDRKGLRQRPVFADSAGAEPLRFEASGAFKRGGKLETTAGVAYDLKPSSRLRERYALTSGEGELATIEAGGWRPKRPVTVNLVGGAEIDDLILLGACWLAQQFAQDRAGATGGGIAGSGG